MAAAPNDQTITSVIHDDGEQKIASEELHPLIQALLEPNRSADSIVEVFKAYPDSFLHANLTKLLTDLRKTKGLTINNLLYAYDPELLFNSKDFSDYEEKVKFDNYKDFDVPNLKAMYDDLMFMKLTVFKDYEPGCWSGDLYRRKINRAVVTTVIPADKVAWMSNSFNFFINLLCLVNSFSQHKICFLNSTEFMRLKTACVKLAGSVCVQGSYSGLGVPERLWDEYLNIEGRSGIGEITTSDSFVSLSDPDHLGERASECGGTQKMTSRELANTGLKEKSTVLMVYPRVDSQEDMLYLIEKHVTKGPTGNEMVMLVCEAIADSCINDTFFTRIKEFGSHYIKIPLHGLSIEASSYLKDLGTGDFLILVVGVKSRLYGLSMEQLLDTIQETNNPVVCRDYSALAVKYTCAMLVSVEYPLIDLYAIRQKYFIGPFTGEYERFYQLLDALSQANKRANPPVKFDDTVIDNASDLIQKFINPCAQAWRSSRTGQGLREIRRLLSLLSDVGGDEARLLVQSSECMDPSLYFHVIKKEFGMMLVPYVRLIDQPQAAPPILYQAQQQQAVAPPLIPPQNNAADQPAQSLAVPAQMIVPREP